MTAAVHNFTIEQGSTFCPTLALRDSAGNLVDITDWEFRMEIREEGPGGPLVIRLDTTTTPATNQVVVLDAPNGKFQLVIADSVTEGFTEAQFEDAEYDLEAVEPAPSNKVRRLLRGCINLSLEVTT